MVRLLIFLLLSVSHAGIGQIHAEFDKSRDFSVYRNYKLGDSEVITPKEKQRSDASTLHAWMKEAIRVKLSEKGLQEADSSADLVVSYLIGSKEQNEKVNLGPQLLGGVSGNSLTADPSQPNRTWKRDYPLGRIIIDMTDRRGNLVWRIDATLEGHDANNKEAIEEVVRVGFKKLSMKPRKARRT